MNLKSKKSLNTVPDLFLKVYDRYTMIQWFQMVPNRFMMRLEQSSLIVCGIIRNHFFKKRLLIRHLNKYYIQLV